MQFKIFAVALLGSTALAQTSSAPAAPAASSAATTPAPSDAAFESAVAGLISSYIPSSVLIPLGSAVQSAAAAAGITGALTDIINSALAAPTPPSWITALPAAYQGNIQSLESAINALKSSEALAPPSGAPSASSNATTSAAKTTAGAPKSPTAAATSSSSSGAAMPAVVIPGAAGVLGLLGVAFAL